MEVHQALTLDSFGRQHLHQQDLGRRDIDIREGDSPHGSRVSL